MERSLLRLIVQKGIRKGEIIECRVGSNIRIGRYVKGNSFTIKDAAISSKHLLIEFRIDKWVVLDLETSNGTLLNDVKIRAMEFFALNNGDDIKIGEETTLKVEILSEDDDDVVIVGSKRASLEDGSERKNRRRQAGKNAAKKARVLDNVDVSDVKQIGKKLKVGLDNGKEVEAVPEIKLRRNPRRHMGDAARNARALKHESDSVSVPLTEQILDESKLGPESNKFGLKVGMESSTEEKLENSSCVLAENKSRRNPRRKVGGAARKDKDGKQELVLHDPDSLPVSVTEPIHGESILGQGNNKNADNDSTRSNFAPLAEDSEIKFQQKLGMENSKGFEVEKSNYVLTENKSRRNPRRQMGSATRKDKAVKQESGSINDSIPEEILNRFNLGVENSRKIYNGASVDNLAPKIDAVGEDMGAIDLNRPQSCAELEKITLGEWFDRMERHLPKKIYDISEEIISSMRTRAEQFHEFLLQQDKKGKQPA